MVSQELLDYVKREFSRGVHENKLRQVLLEYDWPEFEINEAFEKAKQHVEPREKPSGEILEKNIPAEEPKGSALEEKLERIRKLFVALDFRKILTNRIFVVAMILILSFAVFFIILSVFGGKEGFEDSSNSVVEEAKKTCRQYCNSNLCGLFINIEFPQLELKGKNCLDLGVECKQPDGKPKCEVEY